jgi:L-malate glycosyltransferase
MKVVFFTENYYKGGLDTFIVSLINNWPHAEDEIVLICNRSHPGIETYENQINRNVEFRWHNLFFLKDIRKGVFGFFGNNNFTAKIIYHAIKLLSPLMILYYFLSLKKIIFEGDPDRLMVVNGGYPASISCRISTICWGMFNKKNHLSVHNFHNFAVPVSRFNFVDLVLDKFVEKYSSNIVSVSKIASESIRCRKYFQNSTKINFIYNGIALPEMKHIPIKKLRNELLLDEDSLICLMLGTYEKRKGHQFLLSVFIKVIERVPKAHLIICGYGTDNQIENITKVIGEFKLEKSVSLLGFRTDIDDLLGEADLLLIASQAFESFGLTAIEAMTRYIPVVSTNTGGLKEVINWNEGGYTFDRDDIDNYSGKIIELLENIELRQKQGRLGRLRVENNFTIRRMVSEYCKIIRN